MNKLALFLIEKLELRIEIVVRGLDGNPRPVKIFSKYCNGLEIRSTGAGRRTVSEGDTQKSRRDLVFGVALRYRYKLNLQQEARVTPPVS